VATVVLVVTDELADVEEVDVDGTVVEDVDDDVDDDATSSSAALLIRNATAAIAAVDPIAHVHHGKRPRGRRVFDVVSMKAPSDAVAGSRAVRTYVFELRARSCSRWREWS
jgi:hypothetical protein